MEAGSAVKLSPAQNPTKMRKLGRWRERTAGQPLRRGQVRIQVRRDCGISEDHLRREAAAADAAASKHQSSHHRVKAPEQTSPRSDR